MVSFHRSIQRHCFLPAHGPPVCGCRWWHENVHVYCIGVKVHAVQQAEEGASEGKESSARVGCKLPKYCPKLVTCPGEAKREHSSEAMCAGVCSKSTAGIGNSAVWGRE